MRRRRAFGGVILATTATLSSAGACGSDTTTADRTTVVRATNTGRSTTAKAPARPSLRVELSDYGLETGPDIASGIVDVAVHNGGHEQHELQLGRLHDGVTWEQVEAAAHSANPDSAIALISAVGGVGVVDPDVTARSLVRLEPGSYGLFCFVHGWDGSSHLAHGMLRPIEVTAAPAGSTVTEPTSRGDIALADMTITLPPAFDGRGTWRFVNRGPSGHHAVLMRVNAGKTMADARAYLAATAPPTGPAPVTFLGGAGASDPGGSSWLDLDLPPGHYVFLCVIPDPAKGFLPHYMEGMLTEFDVT